MKKIENDLDIYLYQAVGITNTQRQENELAVIMKKRNSARWKLISTNTAVVDTKNQFSNLYLFWEKDIQIFYFQKCFNLNIFQLIVKAIVYFVKTLIKKPKTLLLFLVVF